jgi:uncharacterized protein (DUF2461 family)
MDDFTGFDGDALTTLRALPGWTKQDRAAHQGDYDHLVETTKRFALAMGDRIRETVSDTVVVEPKINGSISPFNRDLRFAEDRSRPYKDHLMVNFWDGADKKSSPTLRVRVTPTHTGFGAGLVFSKATLDRWRRAVAGDPGADLATALEALEAAHPSLDRPGPDLKRVPADLDPEHPREGLLRHKALHVRWEEPNPASIGSAAFVEWCGERLEDLGPVHRWLVSSL